MLKFNITTNDQHKDGFKMSFQAETKEEIDIAKSLSEKLIEKIKSIEVKINNEYGEY